MLHHRKTWFCLKLRNVKNDEGQLSLDEESKKEAWKEHYERLLNVEFPWNPEDLSEESPVEGPSEPITLEIITFSGLPLVIHIKIP